MRLGSRASLIVAFTFLCMAAGSADSVPPDGSKAPATPAQPGTTSIVQVVSDDTNFAVDLYKRLSVDGGNLFFSPHSISTALALTSAGARGATAAQIVQAMRFLQPQEQLHPAMQALADALRKSASDGSVEMHIANRLWGQEGKPFLPAFLDLAKRNYAGGFETVDFNSDDAVKTINDWVAKQTRDKIRDLLNPSDMKPVPPLLVITNAIYFKGKWEQQFKPDATSNEDFQLNTSKKKSVRMMHAKRDFLIFESDQEQMLELPYRGGQFSMAVILPRALDGLTALEKNMTAASLSDSLKNMDSREVEVTLPKFTMTLRMSLAENLKAMGMPLAFSDQADFSGMDGQRDLMIGNVIHKAFVDVNEEGTEAAAATGVIMAPTAVAEPRQPVIFKADHPFMFVIRHKPTGAVLFMGRVAEPTSTK